MEQQYIHKDLTDRIISAFYKVYNELGFGFLENVYQNALYIELLELGLNVANIEIGLLINFGKQPEIRRKIFTNDRKSHQHTDNADNHR